jgi:hypothetical protein
VISHSAAAAHHIANSQLPPQLRTDPIPDEPRLKIRVNVRTNATTICGQRIKRGIRELVIFKSELPKVMALVETDEAGVLQAQKAFEDARTRWVEEKLRSIDVAERESERPRLMRRYINHVTNGKISHHAYFQEINGRGIKPLIGEPEVLEELSAIKPDMEVFQERIAAQNVAQMTALGEAMGKSFAAELAKVLGPIAAAQSAQRK